MGLCSHINRAMCVDYSSAFMLLYASIINFMFGQNRDRANAQTSFIDFNHTLSQQQQQQRRELITTLMNAKANDDYNERTTFGAATISEAAQAVKDANPTYLERCFPATNGVTDPVGRCWYCDPLLCVPNENDASYNKTLRLKQAGESGDAGYCANEACNGMVYAERIDGYNFGCGYELNHCKSATFLEGAWFTIAMCRQARYRTDTNCNCDPDNLVSGCTITVDPENGSPLQPLPSPSPPPSPPPPTTPVISNNENEVSSPSPDDPSFTNVNVTTLDYSPPSPSPGNNETTSSPDPDSGFMTPSKLGGAAVGLAGIFLLAAFVGYRNYICAKLVPSWYKKRQTRADEENVVDAPEWTSSTKKKMKKKTKKNTST
jgi:hypothetical protein